MKYFGNFLSNGQILINRKDSVNTDNEKIRF